MTLGARRGSLAVVVSVARVAVTVPIRPCVRAVAIVAAHACSSTQYSPSVATSFFQIGTRSFSVSMA